MKLIDADKLLEWLRDFEQHPDHAETTGIIIGVIDRGHFDPPAPEPQKLAAGDVVRHSSRPELGTGKVLKIAKSGIRAYVDFDAFKDWDKSLHWAPYPAYYELRFLIKEEGDA